MAQRLGRQRRSLNVTGWRHPPIPVPVVLESLQPIVAFRCCLQPIERVIISITLRQARDSNRDHLTQHIAVVIRRRSIAKVQPSGRVPPQLFNSRPPVGEVGPKEKGQTFRSIERAGLSTCIQISDMPTAHMRQPAYSWLFGCLRPLSIVSDSVRPRLLNLPESILGYNCSFSLSDSSQDPDARP